MKNNRGMTLIEIVIALAIFGMITVAIYPAFLVLAKMNLLSKANLSSNYIAQDVSETLFHYSQSLENDDLISELVSDQGFTIDSHVDQVYNLSKIEDNFRISITITFSSPTAEFVTTVVNVASMNQAIAGQNSQIESILSFGA
jgi:prepilin-type N-terminal cleavage/methylation domain-containing protein